MLAPYEVGLLCRDQTSQFWHGTYFWERNCATVLTNFPVNVKCLPVGRFVFL